MMDIVTIDFETYYDKDFSLSKMTTEAYVRDPRFEVIGVGVKVNDYPTDWYTGDNPGRFLKGLDYSNKAILCHNTAFDGAILSWHFGIRPRLWLDTLSMARPFHQITVGGSLAKLAAYYGLGQKGDEVVAALGKRRADFTPEEMNRYGQYCINDANLTKQLFDKLKRNFPSGELLVIDQTLRMYTEPLIELDVPLLEQHLFEVRERKAKLMQEVDVTTGDIMSNPKFAVALQRLGVEPPTKVSLTTGKETWAFAKTDKGMTDLLEHPDVSVQALAAARLGVKSTIEETRTEALISVASRGPLPILLNYYGAHTGRFSGGDKMNLQNLPARGSSNAIRRSLKAPDGHVLISSDSSQIEARMVAYIAGQDDLVSAFRDKRDVYSEFATEVYSREITKADKVERFVGKTCILGLGYGMGAAKLQRTLEIGQGGISVKVDLSEAERIVRIYRAKNFKIVQLWQKCGYALTAMLQGGSGHIHDVLAYDNTGITLPNKLKIHYPALRATSNGFEYIADARTYQKALKERVLSGTSEAITWTRIYGGKVTENLIQALAAIVIREQMAAIGQHYRVAFQVHDEIIIAAPHQAAESAEAKLVQIMSTAPKWAPGLPVACESGAAANYGDT
jgi:DNA polymerase